MSPPPPGGVPGCAEGLGLRPGAGGPALSGAGVPRAGRTPAQCAPGTAEPHPATAATVATAATGHRLDEDEKSFSQLRRLPNPGRAVGSGGETQQALAAEPQFRVPDTGRRKCRRPHGQLTGGDSGPCSAQPEAAQTYRYTDRLRSRKSAGGKVTVSSSASRAQRLQTLQE